jgi:hypothetical protein
LTFAYPRAVWTVAGVWPPQDWIHTMVCAQLCARGAQRRYRVYGVRNHTGWQWVFEPAGVQD